MAKQVSVTQNNFSGGVSDDPRASSTTQFIISKHFDIFTNPNRLTPYRSFEADTNDGSTSTGMKQYFVKDYLYKSSAATLYGLGQTGAGLTKIVSKADATTGNWTLPSSSEGNGAVQNGCLVEYKDYLWGFQGTTQVWKYGLISATPSITNTAGTVGTITSVAQGIIAKDDNLYLPYNNKLARVTSGGTVNDAVLTLPTNFKITSICNYGLYLAIGCAPVASFNGVSKVFLWNLTSTDVQEVIDWGEGDLRVLETIEGMLVGVTDRYLNNSVGAGRGSMIIQGYQGGVPQILKEVFTAKLNGIQMPISKSVKNNRLFFAAKIMKNAAGTIYDEGIWSFGRKNASYPYALTLDYVSSDITTAGIQAFGSAGNFFFISHSGDGGILKTNDAVVYTEPSVIETQIQNFGDSDSEKRIDKIKVSFRALASGEVLTVKMKVDDDTSWTTIGTFSTVGEVSKTFLRDETNNKDFASGREFLFRFESEGGLEITAHTELATILNTI